MKYFFPLLLILTVFSCKKTKKDTATYFGGKILNPKSKHVILFDFEKALDTIYLKDDNTFLGKFDSISEGLYYFKHGPEHQYVYLEPNDSLLLRLNTWDFDESLVYSGSSSSKNNALIDSFLENEREQQYFANFSSETPEDFMNKIDGFLIEKEKKLETFKSENPTVSDKYLNILKISNTYPIYRQIENFYIKNNTSKDSVNLPKSFLKHRKLVSLGLDSIMFFNPYSQYITTRIYSDTYQQGFKKDTDEYTVALLKNIDKNIKSEKLKNVYLRHATIRHFYNKSSCNLNKKAFYTFFKLNSNIEDKKNIQRLLNDAKSLVKGEHIPNFKIESYTDKTYNINKLIKNKNNVIYFRSPEHYSDEWVASRINYLTKNNPDINFITINITDKKDYSVKNLNINKQYYLPKNSIANQFLTSHYPRTILVNKNGKITNGFGAISSQKIDTQIAELQKK